MRENVEIKYNGLKCDNENCDYHNPDIKRKDFFSYINSYCPDCGDPLLTLNDYMNLVVVEESVKLANKMDLGDKKDEEIKTVKINTHGTITFDDISTC
jgi:hypothetical protein